MFCVNIRLSPETAKKYDLTEDSVFEVFYDAPVASLELSFNGLFSLAVA